MQFPFFSTEVRHRLLFAAFLAMTIAGPAMALWTWLR